MKTLLCVAVLALGALGGQEKKPTGSGGYVQPAPFDVPPTEWDQEFPSVTSSIKKTFRHMYFQCQSEPCRYKFKAVVNIYESEPMTFSSWS